MSLPENYCRAGAVRVPPLKAYGYAATAVFRPNVFALYFSFTPSPLSSDTSRRSIADVKAVRNHYGQMAAASSTARIDS